MINLSELVRESEDVDFHLAFKLNYGSDVYLAEDVMDFEVNKDRIYVPLYKQFPLQILDPHSKSYYVKMNNVAIERIPEKKGFWSVGDESGQLVSLWHDGEKGDVLRSEFTYKIANAEQGFESGDWVYALTLQYFPQSALPVIIDLQRDDNWDVPEKDSLLDKIKNKFDELIQPVPVPCPDH
jgi:hypothetical protein